MSIDRTRSSLELLLNISRELASSLDLHTVLERVLVLSTRHVGAERASLIVLGDDGKAADAAIITDGRLHPHTVDQMEGLVTTGLAGWALRHRQTIHVPDTSRDERWERREDDRAERTGAKSAICVPLKAQEDIVGVLTLVHPQPGFFTREHVELVQAIADIAGIAVRNAQLYQSNQEARQRYHELFEDSIDPIVLTGWNGVIQEANRQMGRFTETPVEELIGHNIADLHEVQWDRVGPGFRNLRGGQTVTYESQVHLGTLPARPVQVNVRLVAAGENSALQWLLRDISERKELDSLREDLAAMIYHDLRSPLANIQSSLDILDSMLPPAERDELEPIFQIALRSADRMHRLISSLLDINRLEAGQPISNKKPVDPKALLEEAAEAVRAAVQGKRQQLTLEVPEALPTVLADGDMLRRVLINLLENASKFTPPQGSLTAGARAENGRLVMWVDDTGPGIPEEAREVVFQKFSRLQATGSPKGMGLGLAFCRLAVEAHGGRIWVEDRPVAGSRFIFYLPAGAGEPDTTDTNSRNG